MKSNPLPSCFVPINRESSQLSKLKHLDRPTGKGLEASAVHEGMDSGLFSFSSLAYRLNSQLCRQIDLSSNLAVISQLAFRQVTFFLNLKCVCGDNHTINLPIVKCKDYMKLSTGAQHRACNSASAWEMGAVVLSYTCGMHSSLQPLGLNYLPSLRDRISLCPGRRQEPRIPKRPFIF